MNRFSFASARFTSRAALLTAGLVFVAAAASFLFFVRSCDAKQKRQAEDPANVERLRALTRRGALPSESVAAEFAKGREDTRAGALARIVRARIRAAANDFKGAAELLNSSDVRERTSIADRALFMRAEWLEKAGRRVEARAAYEEVARDHSESSIAREAALRAAALALADGQGAAVPTFLKKLSEEGDAQALLLTAKAYERMNEPTRALGAYRRIYFHAPTSAEAETEAASALNRLGSSLSPANAEEAATRATRLSAARRHAAAVDAYSAAFARFPETATPEARLRAGQAALSANRNAEAANFFSGALLSPGDLREELQYNLSKSRARARQWASVRELTEEMRRASPKSRWTMLALVEAGQAAKEAKNAGEAFHFQRAAVASFPGEPEVAGAQFEIAWAAHESKNYAEASRLLIEHLADYAGRNTDNRGRAGYWAARNSERAGRTAEARILYEAMLERYDANWYGYLSRQRLDALARNAQAGSQTDFAPSSSVARAAANLRYVSVAEETAGAEADASIKRADDLHVVGLDSLAHAELDRALEKAPASPRLSLAKARVHRSNGENVEAIRALARSFPDYSQMEVEEMTPEQWDVFYPLSHWDAIKEEARARSLDHYTVAGLIRQESVFNPRAASHANAHGLMQLLPETARMVARRTGIERAITVESLYEPRLNIQLGTSYMREQLDRFGRIEYLAAAYNAGPGRAVAWRASLPAEIDEWAEAVPFRETRGYIQGVIRNTLQYRRLYDEEGRFRPEVGSRAVTNDGASENVRRQSVAKEEEE